MKIVLTAHQFLPDFIGGTEVLTFETARELQKRGHEVIVWAGFPSKNSGMTEQYIHEEIRVTRYHHDREHVAMSSDMMRTDYRNDEFGRLFLRHLEDERPDVIHFFHLGRLSLTAVEAGSRLNIPMLFTATDYWLVCPTSQLRLPDNALCRGPKPDMSNCLRHLMTLYGPSSVRKAAVLLTDGFVSAIASLALRAGGKFARPIRSLRERASYMKAAMDLVGRIVVPTGAMRDLFCRYGFDRDRVILQPFGINIGSGNTTRTPDPGGLLRIGFIGTLSEIKGPHVLIEAVKHIPRNLPVEVSIYGKAMEYPEYGSRIEQLAAADPRITCYGTFPPDEIGRILADLDVLVVPSLWHENTPLVIHAAQAARIPVVASDIDGVTEIITHERNGLLFERGNASALAAHLRRLAEDRELLEQLSAQAKQQKSAAAYVDETEELYQLILREKKESS